MREDSKIKTRTGIQKMGWLREHSALKVTPIRDRSASPFDGMSFDAELYEHEQAQWESWRQRPAALGKYLLAQATQEMQTRNKMPRKRGRPSALSGYKEYKRFFLQEWARFITASAKRKGIAHEELAHFVSESDNGKPRCKGWIGGNWRELLRAAGHHRMTWELFNVVMDEVVYPRSWNILRQKNMVTIWTRRLITSQEFEELALQSSPQFHHTKGAN